MPGNRKVFLFVICSVMLFLLISILAEVFHFKWDKFKRVNLISDILQGDSTDNVINPPDSNTVVIENKPHEDFQLYQRPRFITNFSTDTSKPALDGFIKKLYDLKNGKKRKIRIAYFGDSMIEGDLLTQTFRKLLQQAFGGSGVGFVPITSQVAGFRTSVTDYYSGGWDDENFKTSQNGGHLYLSGHLFRSSGDWVQMKDQTIMDTAALIEKSFLCGQLNRPVDINVNGNPFTLHADNIVNRIVIGKDQNPGIKLSLADNQLPAYGISFESDSGIFVDNFSFRGITGIEFARIDSSFLTEINKANPYDLIIFQYGVNLLFRPNDRNFGWYAKALLPIIRKFKSCFDQSDLMVISTADRAFRYGGEYRSAVGIDSLVKVQALLAFETGSVFYNQFQSMGGTNSIVDWASRNPSLANKDYVHPNHRGAEILGEYLFEAVMNDLNKYAHTIK